MQNFCKSHNRYVRRFLTHNASILVANALVGSRLDYCNSLFRSLSKFNQLNLHYIQNNSDNSARSVSNTSGYTSLIPVLEKLHWLSVEHCPVFKTTTLIYKFLQTGFPKYFAPYLSFYSSCYSTRRFQSGGNILIMPKFFPSIHKSVKQFGYSFAFDTPTAWNCSF